MSFDLKKSATLSDSPSHHTDEIPGLSLLGQLVAYLKSVGPRLVILILVSTFFVPFIFGTVTHQRDQVALLHELQATTNLAAAAAQTQDLSPLPAEPFKPGTAVALLSIPAIGVQQVIVEGSGADQTRRGPGHMAGTSGFGQKGNAVIVGRRVGYGGIFLDLKKLKSGDQIQITSIQGVSTYTVDTALPNPDAGVFGQSTDNRLTLVTSNPPIAAVGLITVKATLVGKPFISYPQEPSWMAVHPLGVTGNPLPIFLVMLVLLTAVHESFRYINRTFSRSVTWVIAAPITLATCVILMHVLDRLLPASL